jgi:hypothetical protein
MMFSAKPMLAVLVLLTSTLRGTQEARLPAVEMQYCGMRPGKPPLLDMAFNVTVRNFADKPQWFLFPAALYDKAVGVRSSAGIDGIELFADSPDHKVTVVHFMGTMNLQPEGAGGFKGLLLPAGGVVSVHSLDIEFWGDPVPPVPMRVVIADQVTLGGVPVEQWMGKKTPERENRRCQRLGPCRLKNGGRPERTSGRNHKIRRNHGKRCLDEEVQPLNSALTRSH